MATEPREIRWGGTAGQRQSIREEPSLGELFRKLSDDATLLVREEVALGKAELRQTAAGLTRDLVKLSIASSIAFLGAMTAVALAVVALAILLANLWLSLLLITVLLLGIAAIIGMSALSDLKRDLKPTQTIETLREDAQWAKQEVQAVKRELRS